MLKFLAVAAVAAVGVNAVNTYHSVSFCQRYASALTGLSSQGETDLIKAVVDRFLSGNTTTTANGMAVQGLLTLPMQIPYFNGSISGSANFLQPGTAQTNLIQHLYNFFQYVLGCRDIASIGSFSSDMAAVHAGLNIPKAVWDQFITQFVATVQSFGVTNPTPSTNSDITYLAALTAQFKKGGGICTAADCETATGYAQFTSGAVGSEVTDYRWFSGFVPADATDTVTVAPGSNVHWDLGASHSVVETDASYNTLSGGFSSGNPGTTQTFTVNVGTTETTRYFKCGVAAHANMKGKIVIQSSAPAAGASVSASAVVVLAAAVAALIAAAKF